MATQATTLPAPPSVAWGAIAAGAFVAAAVSLILIAVGAGMGFAAVSPWQGQGVSVAAFGVMTGLWLIVVQWIASLLGGYVTGRLRLRWEGMHDDEVLFRDTAHGLTMWSVATVLVAAVLAAASLGAVKSATSGPLAYEVDGLFRSTAANAQPLGDAPAQAVRILTRDAAKGEVSSADATYLRDLVIARTGVTPEEALARVESAVTAAKKAADTARKTASATGFFTALSLLIGAFIASVAAALGGKLRDDTP